MCTIGEVRDLIHEEIFNPKEDGKGGKKSRLSLEVEKHIDAKLNELFWRLIRYMGSSVAIMLVGGTVAWTNLGHDVQNNTDFREAGDGFTAQDGALLQQQIDQAKHDNQRMEEWLIRIEVKLDQALK